MQIKEPARRVNLHGTTTGASDTQAIGTFNFAALKQNNSDPTNCIVDATAHIVLHDTTNNQVRAVDFDLCWLDLAGSISFHVAGSPSYTINMPNGFTWTFFFGTSGTVMTATVSSPGGAGGINTITSGWLELDVHY